MCKIISISIVCSQKYRIQPSAMNFMLIIAPLSFVSLHQGRPFSSSSLSIATLGRVRSLLVRLDASVASSSSSSYSSLLVWVFIPLLFFLSLSPFFTAKAFPHTTKEYSTFHISHPSTMIANSDSLPPSSLQSNRATSVLVP